MKNNKRFKTEKENMAMSIFHTEFVKQQAVFMEEELISIRRRLHACPELGTKEIKTSALIMEYLRQWEIPFVFPVADT